MEKYEIFYRDILIGVLLINQEGLYKYTPNANTEKVKAEISVINEMLTGTDWVEPIPFFKNRIDAAKRFSLEDDISTKKDQFRFKKVSE